MAIAPSWGSEGAAMNEITNKASGVSVSLRDKIEGLIDDYAHALDDEEIDRWPQFFTETGVYHITTRESSRRSANRSHQVCRA
jgi:3-phenylpropionate/cinnamic acid dioxygenase small subunit